MLDTLLGTRKTKKAEKTWSLLRELCLWKRQSEGRKRLSPKESEILKSAKKAKSRML